MAAENIFKYANDVNLKRSSTNNRSTSISGKVKTQKQSPDFYELSANLPLLTKSQYDEVESDLLNIEDGLITASTPINSNINITTFKGDLPATNVTIEDSESNGNKIKLLNVVVGSSVKKGDFIQFANSTKVYQISKDSAASLTGEMEIEIYGSVINSLKNSSASYGLSANKIVFYVFNLGDEGVDQEGLVTITKEDGTTETLTLDPTIDTITINNLAIRLSQSNGIDEVIASDIPIGELEVGDGFEEGELDSIIEDPKTLNIQNSDRYCVQGVVHGGRYTKRYALDTIFPNVTISLFVGDYARFNGEYANIFNGLPEGTAAETIAPSFSPLLDIEGSEPYPDLSHGLYKHLTEDYYLWRDTSSRGWIISGQGVNESSLVDTGLDVETIDTTRSEFKVEFTFAARFSNFKIGDIVSTTSTPYEAQINGLLGAEFTDSGIIVNTSVLDTDNNTVTITTTTPHPFVVDQYLSSIDIQFNEHIASLVIDVPDANTIVVDESLFSFFRPGETIYIVDYNGFTTSIQGTNFAIGDDISIREFSGTAAVWSHLSSPDGVVYQLNRTNRTIELEDANLFPNSGGFITENFNGSIFYTSKTGNVLNGITGDAFDSLQIGNEIYYGVVNAGRIFETEWFDNWFNVDAGVPAELVDDTNQTNTTINLEMNTNPGEATLTLEDGTQELIPLPNNASNINIFASSLESLSDNIISVEANFINYNNSVIDITCTAEAGDFNLQLTSLFEPNQELEFWRQRSKNDFKYYSKKTDKSIDDLGVYKKTFAFAANSILFNSAENQGNITISPQSPNNSRPQETYGYSSTLHNPLDIRDYLNELDSKYIINAKVNGDIVVKGVNNPAYQEHQGLYKSVEHDPGFYGMDPSNGSSLETSQAQASLIWKHETNNYWIWMRVSGQGSDGFLPEEPSVRIPSTRFNWMISPKSTHKFIKTNTNIETYGVDDDSRAIYTNINNGFVAGDIVGFPNNDDLTVKVESSFDETITQIPTITVTNTENNYNNETARVTIVDDVFKTVTLSDASLFSDSGIITINTVDYTYTSKTGDVLMGFTVSLLPINIGDLVEQMGSIYSILITTSDDHGLEDDNQVSNSNNLLGQFSAITVESSNSFLVYPNVTFSVGDSVFLKNKAGFIVEEAGSTKIFLFSAEQELFKYDIDYTDPNYWSYSKKFIYTTVLNGSQLFNNYEPNFIDDNNRDAENRLGFINVTYGAFPTAGLEFFSANSTNVSNIARSPGVETVFVENFVNEYAVFNGEFEEITDPTLIPTFSGAFNPLGDTSTILPGSTVYKSRGVNIYLWNREDADPNLGGWHISYEDIQGPSSSVLVDTGAIIETYDSVTGEVILENPGIPLTVGDLVTNSSTGTTTPVLTVLTDRQFTVDIGIVDFAAGESLFRLETISTPLPWAFLSLPNPQTIDPYDSYNWRTVAPGSPAEPGLISNSSTGSTRGLFEISGSPDFTIGGNVPGLSSSYNGLYNPLNESEQFEFSKLYDEFNKTGSVVPGSIVYKHESGLRYENFAGDLVTIDYYLWNRYDADSRYGGWNISTFSPVLRDTVKNSADQEALVVFVFPWMKLIGSNLPQTQDVFLGTGWGITNPNSPNEFNTIYRITTPTYELAPRSSDLCPVIEVEFNDDFGDGTIFSENLIPRINRFTDQFEVIPTGKETIGPDLSVFNSSEFTNTGFIINGVVNDTINGTIGITLNRATQINIGDVVKSGEDGQPGIVTIGSNTGLFSIGIVENLNQFNVGDELFIQSQKGSRVKQRGNSIRVTFDEASGDADLTLTKPSRNVVNEFTYITPNPITSIMGDTIVFNEDVQTYFPNIDSTGPYTHQIANRIIDPETRNDVREQILFAGPTWGLVSSGFINTTFTITQIQLSTFHSLITLSGTYAPLKVGDVVRSGLTGTLTTIPSSGSILNGGLQFLVDTADAGNFTIGDILYVQGNDALSKNLITSNSDTVEGGSDIDPFLYEFEGIGFREYMLIGEKQESCIASDIELNKIYFRTGNEVEFNLQLQRRPQVTIIPGPGFNYYQYDTFNFKEVL